MLRRCLAALVVASTLNAGNLTAQTLALPNALISLGSERGARLLIDSEERHAYWPLSLQFVTQKSQTYCGVATMVMVLNALGVPAPPTPGIEPFRTFTQDNVLNERTEKILAQEVLLKKGMTLDQLGSLLESHSVDVEVRHAADSNADEFRALARQHLGAPDRHVIVNYLRRAIGQEQGGHISPLAAYDVDTDRFLVLDVSRYKYPPVWVKADDLHAAMNTPDSDNGNRTRGFVLVNGMR